MQLLSPFGRNPVIFVGSCAGVANHYTISMAGVFLKIFQTGPTYLHDLQCHQSRHVKALLPSITTILTYRSSLIHFTVGVDCNSSSTEPIFYYCSRRSPVTLPLPVPCLAVEPHATTVLTAVLSEYQPNINQTRFWRSS